MKTILDVAPQDIGLALNVLAEVQRTNPQQKIGNGGTVRMQAQGKTFDVVRNKNSYTVRAKKK